MMLTIDPLLSLFGIFIQILSNRFGERFLNVTPVTRFQIEILGNFLLKTKTYTLSIMDNFI